MLSSQLTKQDLAGKKGEPAMIGTGSSNFDCRDNGASFFFTNRSLQSITDISACRTDVFFFFFFLAFYRSAEKSASQACREGSKK